MEKKKKDIDLSQIEGLFQRSRDTIRSKCTDESFNSRVLIEIEKIKRKFYTLKDKFEFNQHNEKTFNEKSAKILEFEEQLRKDAKEINDFIRRKMSDNYIKVFGKLY